LGLLVYRLKNWATAINAPNELEQQTLSHSAFAAICRVFFCFYLYCHVVNCRKTRLQVLLFFMFCSFFSIFPPHFLDFFAFLLGLFALSTRRLKLPRATNFWEMLRGKEESCLKLN